MSIQMVGIDHSRAGIDVRSIFSFTKKGMESAFEYIKTLKGVEGCIILSTCNRMELWISCKRGRWSSSLVSELCSIKKVSEEEYEKYFVCRDGREAVAHLFRLSCGSGVEDPGRRPDYYPGKGSPEFRQGALYDGQCTGSAVSDGSHRGQKG